MTDEISRNFDLTHERIQSLLSEYICGGYVKTLAQLLIYMDKTKALELLTKIPEPLKSQLEESYDKLADKIMAGQYRLTGNDFQVLMAIVKCLNINSNIVDVSNITLSTLTGIKPQNISKNLANLEECRLIQRRSGKIITNVNYLFKGNLLDFYHAYKEMYPEDKGYIF
jgi:hypothetical protein